MSYFRLISFTVAPMCQVEVASRQSRISNNYADGLETLHAYGSGCVSSSLSALFYCIFLVFCLLCFVFKSSLPILLDVTYLLLL